MQPKQRRLVFIGIVLLGFAWTLFSADRTGSTTGGLIPAPQKGFLAPDFTLETLDGEQITLSDLRGKVVLLNFWASWCPPCRAEMPAFQEAYLANKEYDFVILAVNATQQDELSDITAFLDEKGITFPVVLDKTGNVNRLYQVQALPTSFFIAPNGVISEVVMESLSEASIRARIDELKK